jgi:negative regulator of flagellin synthesis FlgM
MSSINGINSVNPIRPAAQPVSRPASTEPAEPAAPMRASDRLELSSAGHLMHTLRTSNDIRMDKVASIRAHIEAGTYETPEKLAIAIERLLDDLI